MKSRQDKCEEKNKIARICWNNNGWKFPSGQKGKSSSSQAYENINGFGYEEWLFDKRKIIDGFHYAFLQPLNLKSRKHEGKNYNISLFAMSNLGNKYYVGKIKNAKCISKEESKEVYNIYKQNGWLKEMINEIEVAGGNSKAFKEISPESFVNFKFKFENVIEAEELEEISAEDKNIPSLHFVLLPQKDDFIIEKENQIEKNQGNYKDTSKRKKVFKGESEFDPYHDKMQNAICKLLREEYEDKYKLVHIEKDRVDIKAKTYSNQWHYFEIKTDNPKLSIRKALGQIMEYAYFPEDKRADKLIIISHAEPNNEVESYLRYIRKKFELPIYYRTFNLEKNKLSIDY